MAGNSTLRKLARAVALISSVGATAGAVRGPLPTSEARQLNDPFLARLTIESRRVLFFAREAVSRHGGDKITPRHLVLGILRAVPGSIGQFMTSPGWSEQLIEERFVAMMDGEPLLPESTSIPFASASQLVLDRAAQGADDLGAAVIRPEHLLLPLLDDDGTKDVLRDAGITSDRILRYLKQR